MTQELKSSTLSENMPPMIESMNPEALGEMLVP